MQTQWNNHTFVICAYGESPFLEACIRSVLAQTVKSQVMVSTSTPNQWIQMLAEKYHLPVFINTGRQSIADDWNFAYSQAKTDYITLAHQDDIYEPEYLESAKRHLEQYPDSLIFFTGYYELRGSEKTDSNRNMKIKKMLLLPLRLSWLQKTGFAKRGALALGNAICCPAVTYAAKRLQKPLFRFGYRSNVDWETWEKLSRLQGRFCYDPKPLMCHRIHGGSETSQVLKDHVRIQEDYEMFRKFWPEWIAQKLVKFYAKSEESNQLDK
ncbi:MAG: glycosyltransferase family A protein [Massiliimalia sp.]|jgi:glycosyltransferase involved in cell wall biosynthesis